MLYPLQTMPEESVAFPFLKHRQMDINFQGSDNTPDGALSLIAGILATGNLRVYSLRGRQKGNQLFDHRQVFSIHDGFSSPVMNRNGGLSQTHFILEKANNTRLNHKEL